MSGPAYRWSVIASRTGTRGGSKKLFWQRTRATIVAVFLKKNPLYPRQGQAESDFHRGAHSSTVIPDVLLKRSDAYLKTGNWHLASIDFRRALNGFPDYAGVVDRWREIVLTADARSYIDMKTFDDAYSGAIKLWIKQARGAGAGANRGRHKNE